MSLLHIKKSGDLITCPYDPSHRITALRYTNHLVKCVKNHPNKRDDFTTCPFNATHRILAIEKAAHLASCPDKIVIERDYLRYMPSKPKASIMVPPYSDSNVPEATEDWDEECSDGARGSYLDEIHRSGLKYNQNSQTMALRAPAEKKKAYKQMWSDGDGSSPEPAKTPSDVDNVLGPALQQLRMPKTTSMFQSEQAIRNSCLGLGRGVVKNGFPTSTPTVTPRVTPTVPRYMPAPSPTPSFGSQTTATSSLISMGYGRGIGRGKARLPPFPVPGTTKPAFDTASSVASSADLNNRELLDESECEWTTVGVKSSKKVEDSLYRRKLNEEKLLNKLAQIDALIDRRKKGFPLDTDQLEKISRRSSIEKLLLQVSKN